MVTVSSVGLTVARIGWVKDVVSEGRTATVDVPCRPMVARRAIYRNRVKRIGRRIMLTITNQERTKAISCQV